MTPTNDTPKTAAIKMKYVTVTVSGIIIQIAKPTDVPGYTVGVIESFLPDESELKYWTEKRIEKWTQENNKRMTAICQFLNDNNL